MAASSLPIIELVRHAPPGAAALYLRRFTTTARLRELLVDVESGVVGATLGGLARIASDGVLGGGDGVEARELRLGLEAGWLDASGELLLRAVCCPVPDHGEDELLPWCLRAAARSRLRFELRLAAEAGDLVVEAWHGEDLLRDDWRAPPRHESSAATLEPSESARRTLARHGWGVTERARGLRLVGRGRVPPKPLWLLMLPLTLAYAPLLFLLRFSTFKEALRLALHPLRLGVLGEADGVWIELSEATLRWGSSGATTSKELPIASVGAVSFAPRRFEADSQDRGALRVITPNATELLEHVTLGIGVPAAREIGAALKSLISAAASAAQRDA